ncbi:DUF4232 domain-containing protein [Actinokineospora auranticolor]|nr:DUF4232 domain-containing protein [Actinokineospora auranticolor]
MRWATNRLGIGTALALTCLVAGCGKQQSATPPPSVPMVSATATTAAPPTTTEGAAPGGGDESPAEWYCKVDDLTLTLRDGDAAAGTVYRILVFTNKGGRTCVIQGFPGVSYVAGEDGHQVGPAAFREGAKGGPITLAPGQDATAAVGFVNVANYDPAVCKPTEVRGLRVYPPHDTASAFVPIAGTGCAGTPPGNQLTVHTVVS